MKSLKKEITGDFNTSSFIIEPMGVETGIDPHIKDFILKLNESKHISTIFSCEGHHEGDNSYLYFNVDVKGWDIFWSKVMPELSKAFLIDKGWCLHQLEWTVGVKKNDYNTGIQINTELYSTNHFPDWVDKKVFFWKTVEEIFLKYFLQI
jgi:hypothetical protein